MKSLESQDLSPEEKKLLNILQIKLYDISQNVQIIGKQLTNNQIKDIVSQSYNISHQLKKIFEKCGVTFLYELQRKMQVNSVLICSLLTERLEKQKSKTEFVCKCQLSKTSSAEEIQEKDEDKGPQTIPLNFKMPHLGGVHLYNESHTRGLTTLSLFQKDSDSKGGKSKAGVLRSCKEEFITAVMEEIEDKVQVEVDSVNDEIKTYIQNFKETSRLPNLFSCENELQEIIDFFKMSELEAITFLNKSPNNNNEYTEDYLNRLSDMENDIKIKENIQKDSILQKMKYFVIRLREKVSEIQRLYAQKNAKLKEYEQSLIKEIVSEGTQTFDGYQRKMKELQNKLKEQEEKYKILTEIRKFEEDYENQIHALNQIIDIKNNQNRKLSNAKIELEEEMEAIKKLIREKNERLTNKIQNEKKKTRIKHMLMESLPEEKNQENTSNLSSELKENHPQRKMRKYQMTGNFSSGSHRVSTDTEKLKMFETAQGDFEYSRDGPIEDQDETKIPELQKGKTNSDYATFDIKESGFKIEFKKSGTSKKTAEFDEKQVSFMVGGNSQAGLLERSRIEEAVALNRFEIVRERSFERSRSMVSIQDGEPTRRSNRKNTLKQKIDPVVPRSMKSFEDDDFKKSSKSVSKKCIILKDNRQKSIISTIFKIDKLTIKKQVQVTIQPTGQKEEKKGKELQVELPGREARPSLQRSGINFKSKISQKNLKLKNGVNKSRKDLTQKREKKSVGVDYAQNISNIEPGSSIKVIVEDRLEGEKSVKSIKSIKNNNNLSLKRIEKIQKNENSQTKLRQKVVKTPPLNKFNRQPQGYRSENNSTSGEMSMLANLIKKMGGKEKRDSHLFKNQSQQNQYKLISQQLDQIKAERTEGQSKERFSKMKDVVGLDQFYLKINSLKEEMEGENLSMDQFQEMMRIFSYGRQFVDYDFKSQTASPLEKSLEPQHFKPIQNDISVEVARKKEEVKRSSLEVQKFVRYADSDLYLTGFEMQKLKSIHATHGKCQQIQNGSRCCHHIQKYIQIINKINRYAIKTKISLKLPVEKIGQIEYEKSKDDIFEYMNIKNKKQNDESIRMPRPSDHSTYPYLNSSLNTEEVEEKQRILPIINNTASNYYKAKSKLLR